MTDPKTLYEYLKRRIPEALITEIMCYAGSRIDLVSMLNDYADITRIKWPNGQLKYEVHREFEEKHRIDGPAERWWDEDGNLQSAEWSIEGKKYRTYSKLWYSNGNLKREIWCNQQGEGTLLWLELTRDWDINGKLKIERWYHKGRVYKELIYN